MHFFFSPHADNFSWIQFTETFSKSVFILDIFFTILKFIKSSFKHFYSTFWRNWFDFFIQTLEKTKHLSLDICHTNSFFFKAANRQMTGIFVLFTIVNMILSHIFEIFDTRHIICYFYRYLKFKVINNGFILMFHCIICKELGTR